MPRKKKTEEFENEVVVPAEVEEAPKTKKKAKAKPKEKAKAKETPKVESVKQVHDTNTIGVFSQEIEQQLKNEMSKAEVDDMYYRELLRAHRNGEIMMGEVYGVEQSDALGKIVVAVLWNDIKISIPDSDYFEPKFDFGENYSSMNKNEKLNKHRLMASYQLGAKVYFVVKGIERVLVDPKNIELGYNINVVGSRTEAMAKVRDIWLNHRSINIGDKTNAHVISVREDKVLVECFGMETWIDSRNVSNDIVRNCNDFTKPGKELTVRIRKLYKDDNYIAVTGRLNETSKLIRQMMVGSTYTGTVDSYNKEKEIYNVQLKNGVVAVVKPKDVIGLIPLTFGDNVSVTIYSIYDTHVTGKAMKI